MTCTESERTYRDGEWTVAINRASASGIASLERDFERPDRPARPNAICAAVVVFGAPVLFVDRNGHFLRARYPVEHTCDQPLESVIKAVAAHHWITVATTKVRQQLTPAELAAGCPGEMKNMVAIDLQMGIGRSRGGPVLTHEPNAPLDACIYRISPAQPDLGSFVAGIHFDARQSAALRTALSGPGGIPGPCPAVTRFASIVAKGNNFGVFLQLGGCWRLQRDQAHASLGSASDPALVARLLDPGHSAPRRSQRHPPQAVVRRLACSGESFELSLVRDRDGQPTPVAAAAWFAIHGGIRGLPTRGWIVIGSDASTASLASGTAKLHATRGVDGTWQVDGGRC